MALFQVSKTTVLDVAHAPPGPTSQLSVEVHIIDTVNTSMSAYSLIAFVICWGVTDSFYEPLNVQKKVAGTIDGFEY